MSAAYYKERCEILERENEQLKRDIQRLKKAAHDPDCDGDLWICADCRKK
jgi:hypothetical protein